MAKEKRSNKWAFLIYKESAPDNYIEVLEGLHVPFVLSPWHDKDIHSDTGEIKKAHKHGALYFESLKSYSQVSELITEKLNGPTHVEAVMSPKGMYDYFTTQKILIKHLTTSKILSPVQVLNLRNFY